MWGIKTLPFTIITGFLGSGKTTLLNHLLKHPAVGDVAVIVNEFGEIGLDHLLIESASEQLLLLERGCICCSIRNDLIETLDDLMQRRERGQVSAFNRLVIETTGLADPAPILHTLMTHPAMIRYFYLDSVITTVDATLGHEQLAQYPESVKQVALADRIVLTKTDLSEESVRDALQSELAQLNPGAKIAQTEGRNFDPELILGTGLYDVKTQQARISSWLPDHATRLVKSALSTHSPDIATFCFVRSVPISRAILGLWLLELARDYGDQLLRIKGLVNVEHLAGALAVQGVQHRIYPPMHLTQWPSADQRTRIVFITRKFQQEIIEAHFMVVCQRLSEERCDEKNNPDVWQIC